MKLGTENRTTTIVAVVLFVIAVIMLARMWMGSNQQAAAAPPAVTAGAATAAGSPPVRGRRPRGRTAAARAAAGASALDPRLLLSLLKQSEDTEYTGGGRNIFRAQAEPVIPQAIAPAIKQPPPPPPVYTPPPPPPINLKFFGFASSPGEPKQVFLGNGEDVFVAREGEIVNRRYKVMRINPNSVEIEDVLSNNRQTIPLTAG